MNTTLHEGKLKKDSEMTCHETGEYKKYLPTIHMILVVAVAVLLVMNTMMLASLKSVMNAGNGGDDMAGMHADSQNGGGKVSFDADVIPTGEPRIYGKELGVNYDDVGAQNPQLADSTIGKMAVLDQQIQLQGADKERYIKVVSKISCEYCCGAPSIITQTGDAACGCAHSFAMRGLAKYLITKHPTEFSDDEILEELGKWKTLFFPGQLSQKAKVLKDKGIALNYINLASNAYRGIEKGAAGSGMVGGC